MFLIKIKKHTVFLRRKKTEDKKEKEKEFFIISLKFINYE